MDSKQVAKLRGWQRKYGAAGVLMAGGYLCWEHWRARIRARAVLSVAVILTGGMLLWPRPARHALRPHAAPLLSRESQQDLDASLLTAVRDNRLANVLACLQQGASVNAADGDHQTALTLACTYCEGNDFSILNALLARGADVVPAHNNGWNVLCWAAERDDAHLAEEILRRGLDVNSRDKRGRAPLMYAAANGTARVMALLLSQGTDVNACDELGWTALMFAAQKSNLAGVEALLKHNADQQARDRENGWTAEQRAQNLGQDQAVELLRTGRMPIHPMPSAEDLYEKESDALPAASYHVRIDSHRWIETVHVPNIIQECGEGACGVVIADGKRRRGRPFGGETFFFRPEAQVFRDVDGRLYAFVKGHHRSESNFIAAIRGLTLVKKAECYARYEAICQPLPEGGALITTFGRNSDVEGVPAVHLEDGVSEVSRFRNGKLTHLGFLIEPSQN